MARFLTTFFILILLAFSLTARADLFQYTDQDGTVVMVDDESKIPQKYRKKTRTTKADPVAGSKSTAVRVNNNQVLVPVRFSYRNTTVDAWLLLDTGASTTSISTDLADRLGIKPDSMLSFIFASSTFNPIDSSRNIQIAAPSVIKPFSIAKSRSPHSRAHERSCSWDNGVGCCLTGNEFDSSTIWFASRR
jgi:hypothetical protein